MYILTNTIRHWICRRVFPRSGKSDIDIMDVTFVLQGASENIIKGIAIEATAGDDVIEVVLVVPYTALES